MSNNKQEKVIYHGKKQVYEKRSFTSNHNKLKLKIKVKYDTTK